MALVFHDGFETGGADAWNSVVGSPTFIVGAAKTGNYGMRCNTSAAIAYVKTRAGASNTIRGASFYLYINSTPSVECTILYAENNTTAQCFRLTLGTDRKINFYDKDDNLDDTTINALNTGQWYRISAFIQGTTLRALVDGDDELVGTQASSEDWYETAIGVYTSCNADLYFDDFAWINDFSDPGDIRTLAARPTANGTDQDFGNLKWQDRTGGVDQDVTSPSYTRLADDPPDTDEGAWEEADGNAHYYSIALDDCGSGNLSGIGGSDTIEAVHFMWHYETAGGGFDGAYVRRGRNTSGTDTDWVDDPKDPTWVDGYSTQTYEATPADWTQSNFNSQEMGMGCTDANKDMWWYEAYAMVAFKVPASGNVTVNPTALSISAALKAPTIVGDITFTATALALSATIIAPTVLVEASASPSMLAATLTLNAPTISIVQDALVTPTALALTATLNEPTVSIIEDALVTPTVLALTATLIDPTVSVSQNALVTPTALALTSTLIEPTISIVQDASVSPTVLSLIAALNSPTIVGDVTISPSSQSLTATLIAPSIVCDVTAAPSALGLTATLHAPTIDIVQSVTVEPAVLALQSAIIAPTISISQNALVTPSALNLTATLNSPSVVCDFILSPSALSVTATLNGPAIVVDVAISTSALSLTATLNDPIVDISGNVTIYPAAAALTVSIQDPAIVIVQDVTVQPTALGLTATVNNPSVKAGLTVAPVAMNVISTILAPVVKIDATFTSSPFALTGTIHAPSLNISVDISPSSFGLTGQLIAPLVAIDSLITPSALEMLAALHDPTVIAGGGAAPWLAFFVIRQCMR